MVNEVTRNMAEHAYAAGCFQGLAWRLRAFSDKIDLTDAQQTELDSMIDACEKQGKHFLALSKSGNSGEE